MAPIFSSLTSLGGGGNGGFGFGRRSGNKRKKFLATGGTITTKTGTDGKQYRVHEFRSTDNFVVSSSEPNYLINVYSIGGGNGGNNTGPSDRPGAGGPSAHATSLKSIDNFVSSTYNVVIGSGGGAGGGAGGPAYLSRSGTKIIETFAGPGPSTATKPATATQAWSYNQAGGAGRNSTCERGEGYNPGGPGGLGGNSWAGNNPFYTGSDTLYPNPLQSPSAGAGGGGGAPNVSHWGECQPGSGGAGNPGGMLIYYPIEYI